MAWRKVERKVCYLVEMKGDWRVAQLGDGLGHGKGKQKGKR